MSLVICEMVVKISKRKCLGCLHTKRLHLNHMCEQTSLLEKFVQHYDAAHIKVTDNLKTIMNRFTVLFPAYANQSESCYTTAHNFLSFSTARSIYYGGYCEDEELYKAMIDGVQDSSTGKPVPDTPPVKLSKQPTEKPKPIPLKRQRKSNQPPQQPNIEKVLSDAYEELYS